MADGSQFGAAARLGFMHPIAHVMLWVAFATWALVAAAFLAHLAGYRRAL